MNRIILIGNGFDKAHRLKTGYDDFIGWYWDKRVKELETNLNYISFDILCTLELLLQSEKSWSDYSSKHKLRSNSGKKVYKQLSEDKMNFRVTESPFFSSIMQSFYIKGWVDIENEYYRLLFSNDDDCPSPYLNKPNMLNRELDYIRLLLLEYLTGIQKLNINKSIVRQSVKDKVYAPVKKIEIAVGSRELWNDMLVQRLSYSYETWKELISICNREDIECKKVESFVHDTLNEKKVITDMDVEDIPEVFFLPDKILFLSFNYTTTADLYLPGNERISINHIHGRLDEPNSMIFGYGDEIDKNYKTILEKNDNDYLENIKSIKYLESPNYRQLLEFIESSPYQIFIMGHSCGNSDRTLLNTLFEHKNCVSIKPFYYIRENNTDNYLELVQNISRNFTDMKLMRDRVVNKKYCDSF